MKGGVVECLSLGDDCASSAAEQTKPGHPGGGVQWAIKPAGSALRGSENRRPGSPWHLLGLRARRAKPARWSSSVTPGGQGPESKVKGFSCAAPAGPTGPGPVESG